MAGRSQRVWKGQDSGARELLPYISQDDVLIVCGMNTDACVIRTVRDLRLMGFTVIVAGDACWTAYAARNTRPHHHALNRMRGIDGVCVTTTASLIAT